MPDKVALELATQISRQNVSKEGWTTYYVDGTNGNDGANGLTWESAFKTIQYAIDTAESWAKIYVKAGTYVENVTVDKEGIRLIGEKRDTVIIQPTSGVAVSINSENVSFERAKVVSPTDPAYCIEITGDFCTVDTVLVDGVDGSRGISIGANNSNITNIYSLNANLRYAIVCGSNTHDNTIHDNILTVSRLGAATIAMTETAHNYLIYNNTLLDSDHGILMLVGSLNNRVFHNNFLNISAAEILNSGSNIIFENHYSSHTTDLNHDGITDTPFTFTTGTDYSPVAHRDGWKQVSLGMTAGAPQLNTSISDFDVVLLDDRASFYLSILDSNGDLPTAAEIDVSTAVYKIYRSAGGAAFVQVGTDATPSEESGGVYFDYVFATADFSLEDIVKIELSGVSVTIGSNTVAIPKQIWLGRVTDEASVKATVEAIKVETDKLTGGEYTGIVSAGTAAETTIKEITPVTKRTEIKSIWLDFVNLTADATIKLYHKIDNATPVYRVFEVDSWVSTDDDGVLITGFTINNDFKITITGGEGAGVNIPYNIIYQEME